jgi:hypothetical protein
MSSQVEAPQGELLNKGDRHLKSLHEHPGALRQTNSKPGLCQRKEIDRIEAQLSRNFISLLNFLSNEAS